MLLELEPTYEDVPSVRPVVLALRDFLAGELAEFEERHELTNESAFSRQMLQQVWKRSRELGFYGIHLPPEYGGSGLSYSHLAILKEEVTASGRVLHHSVLGDMGGPLRLGQIFDYATPSQLDRYLLPVVRGDRACCFSLTETEAGSDVRAMQTTATSDGPGWRLTGRKVFSTAGPFADFSVLVARMSGTEESYSAFFVDLNSPGCIVLPGEIPISGQHTEADIVLNDCYVAPEQLIGPIGAGLRIGLGRVTTNRLLHCPAILGHVRRLIRLTVDFASSRVVFGGRLADLQVIRHKIADMVTGYYAARCMTYQALAKLDAGARPDTEAFMCKLFVAETAFRVADDAMQIHGKAGMIRGSEVEWLFRRLRMFRITTGSSEIQKNGIAKAVLDSVG